MKGHYFLLLVLAINSVCVVANGRLDTKLFVNLPETCPVPDNLTVAPDGSLSLTCPNFRSEQPPVILRVTSDGEVSKLTSIPGIKPDSLGRPMGLDYDSDGVLYVCNGNGQVLRMTFHEGAPDRTEVIAKGVKCNGLKYHNGYVYVTNPRMRKIKSEHMTGGLYRFSASDRNVKVKGQKTDPNLIFTAETTNPVRQVSLDGLIFDSQGRLYVGEFGDATVYQLTLDAEGKVSERAIYAQLPIDTGIDGMFMDKQDNLYVTGFSSNRLVKVDVNQKITVVAEYPDNNGANGELDQPVDIVIFDNKLVIANFGAMVAPDMVNKSHDKPYTLSYINLEDL